LKELVGKFSSNTSEFFKSLNDILSTMGHGAPDQPEKMKQLIERNEKFFLTFTDLLFERDSDVKDQLLDCKIKVCEREILINEKKMAIESWQRRFNQYYKKYNDLKKVLEVPFEEDHVLNYENRTKIAMNTIKEERLESTINNLLSEFFCLINTSYTNMNLFEYKTF
jgi:hypothetical protein